MNVWPGTGVDGWLNPFNGKTPLTAEYDWIKYTKYDVSSHSGSINWSTDPGWAQYALEKNGDSTVVLRYGNQNAAWAYLLGDMQNQVAAPNRFKPAGSGGRCILQGGIAECGGLQVLGMVYGGGRCKTGSRNFK